MEYKVFSGGKGGYLQATIPRRLAEAFGLKCGDSIRWEVGPGRSLLLRPVREPGKGPE